MLFPPAVLTSFFRGFVVAPSLHTYLSTLPRYSHFYGVFSFFFLSPLLLFILPCLFPLPAPQRFLPPPLTLVVLLRHVSLLPVQVLYSMCITPPPPCKKQLYSVNVKFITLINLSIYFIEILNLSINLIDISIKLSINLIDISIKLSKYLIVIFHVGQQQSFAVSNV